MPTWLEVGRFIVINRMEERKEIYKCFENKEILIITKSDFKYHTSNLQILGDYVKFTDNRNQEILLDLNEIKFIQEVNSNDP